MAHSAAKIAIAILSLSFLCNLVSSATTDFNLRSFTCTHARNASFSYKNNVNFLFSDFISQSSLKGYYNTSVGNSPDVAFGYYMCRGDLKPEACKTCITNGTRFAQEATCDYQDGAFLSVQCIFRYANQSMYGVLGRSSSLTSPLWTNTSNYPQYNQTLSSTLEALINEASLESGNNGSIPGLATKEANVTGDEKIYSLAQCTPDIVGVNCSRCLRNALSTIWSLYDGYKGAQISTTNCILSYNNQSFYDLEAMKPSEDDSESPNQGVGNSNKVDGLKPPNLVVVYSVLVLFMYYTYLILD